MRAGRIDNFADCSENYSTTGARSGNPKLKPETSTDWTVGTVIEPHFIPSRFGHFTLTADYWDIRQKGIVGIFGEDNALTLDYLLRTQGSSNPDVVRAAPTADDIAQFAGTGLAPVGSILYVTDEYRNLLPQHVSGIDLGFSWQLRGTSIGDFSVSANAAYLLKFYQSPSPDVAALIAARAAGQINAGTYIFGGGNLLRQNGKPRWKVAGTFIWDYGRFELGAYTQYTSSVEDTDLIDSAGAPWMVDSLLTGNVYGQVTIGEKGGHQMQLRLGVRNVTNAKPPLDPSGYLGTLYNPYTRYLYVNVRTTF
jgi:outer membrane receptor protein involved in Fe transport